MNTQPLFDARRDEHFSRTFFRFGSSSTGASQPAFSPCSMRASLASAVETTSASKQRFQQTKVPATEQTKPPATVKDSHTFSTTTYSHAEAFPLRAWCGMRAGLLVYVVASEYTAGVNGRANQMRIDSIEEQECKISRDDLRRQCVI